MTINFFLFFPIALVRLLIRLLRLPVRSENRIHPAWLNFFLRPLFRLEVKHLRRGSYPFGVSVWTVARK